MRREYKLIIEREDHVGAHLKLSLYTMDGLLITRTDDETLIASGIEEGLQQIGDHLLTFQYETGQLPGHEA